jgi:small subunit ribosomal protein S20
MVESALSRFIDEALSSGKHRHRLARVWLARITKSGYYARSFLATLANKGFFMANTAQARKRGRQSENRRQHNASLKSQLRSAIRKVRKAVAAGDKAAARREFQAQQSVIDRIADKKVVHKNTAARNKTRLAQAIKAMP